MRVLITGGTGQVGRNLVRTAPMEIEVIAPGREELDITHADGVNEVIAVTRPDVIINAAAYTAVDRAESEPETARAVNAGGAANLARAAARTGCFLIHISTDFVFDGGKTTPWLPDDPARPLGVYGMTKAEGEAHIQDSHGGKSLILRTSWVYSARGHNFVRTMLRLMAERDELRVVSDQRGSPTRARNLALAIWELIDRQAPAGTFHWSDAGATSWYDFACAIRDEGRKAGLSLREVDIRPVATEEYPAPARRPAYSVLDTTATEALLGHGPQPWREALREMMGQLKRQSQDTGREDGAGSGFPASGSGQGLK